MAFSNRPFRHFLALIRQHSCLKCSLPGLQHCGGPVGIGHTQRKGLHLCGQEGLSLRETGVRCKVLPMQASYMRVLIEHEQGGTD